MLKRFSFILIYLLLLLPGVHSDGLAAASLPTTDSSVLFIANVGQWDESVRYQATTRNGVLWLTDEALWLTRLVPDGQINIRLTFPNLNPETVIEPFDRQETVVSYFRGRDPSHWHGAVPVWAGLRLSQVAPGVDLLLAGQNGQVTPVLVGDGPVTMQVEGAEEVTVRGRELHFLTPAGSLTWPWPIGQLVSLSASQLVSQSALSPQSSVLSPQHSVLNGSPLIFGTFIGGQDTLPDYPNSTTLDVQGNIYSTGYTESPFFPTEPGFSPQHGIDVIVTKLLADGSDLAYAIHINPSAFNQPDYGYGILVNGAGEAYVVGETNSFDFPITPGALDETFDNGDAFFFKVAADGDSLLYSTYLGGSDLDGVRGLVQDAQGNFYLTGQTWSLDFPVTTCLNPPPYPTGSTCHKGVRDLFVTKLNPTGTAILYSTLLGGEIQEQAQAIVVEPSGQATVTGWTNSADFPVSSGSYDETFNGVFDAFVSRINPSGTALVYSTFLGGDNEDRANSLALHNDGRVTLTGTTLCPCTIPWPTTGTAYDSTHNGSYDLFVTQLAANGATLGFSTFLGGTAEDRGQHLSLADDGEILLTGRTDSGDFPVTAGSYDETLGGSRDAFITVMDGTASNLLYGSFLGGSNEDEGSGILVGPAGTLILSGSTRSADFPVTAGAYDTTLNGDYDLYIVKFQFWDNPIVRLFLPLLRQP